VRRVADGATGNAGDETHRHDVVVIGGGVIGLSIAWRSAASGLDVAIVDPEPGSGATWAAAGMLAPVTEVHYGEETLLALNLASAGAWPSFAAELESAAGMSVAYLRHGTLAVAVDEGDRGWARQLFEFQVELGLEARWLSAREARSLEPALSPSVRSGMLAPQDHQVDNRLLFAALLEACRRDAVCFHRAKALVLESGGGMVEGVSLDDGSSVRAGSVVLACGAWSSSVGGVPAQVVPPVRPVKGQIIRLGPSSRVGSLTPTPALRRSVRGVVNGSAVYLVPRADGTVVVGATAEEMGFDTTVTAGAVYELLRDAHRVVPAVAELELVEVTAGVRPGSPDNAPIIGRAPSHLADGLVLATGHYRNGILLAPVTADAVTALLAGREPKVDISACSPSRFEVPSWDR
jgi:glycine oxidase